MAPVVLEAKEARFGWRGRTVVRASLSLKAGGWVSIIGPNGAGKSTLLHGLAGLIPLMAGRVTLLGEDLSKLKPRRRAQLVSLMRQIQSPVYPFTVYEIVLQGRYPHGKAPQDEEKALQALARVRAEHLAERPFSALSGGERQKVWLARLIAQETPILLLDEPAAHLDPAVKHEIYQVLKGLCREGRAVLCVLHDLSYASLLSDELILLKEGRVFAQGAPEEVLTPETLEALYGAPFTVLPHPETGKPLPLPSVSL